MVERALRGAPVPLVHGVIQAFVTMAVTIPPLVSVARVLKRDQVLAA